MNDAIDPTPEPLHYDEIGVGYANSRRRERRIADAIAEELGSVARILDVGSGTGSYEPDRPVVISVEPSQVMIDQRPPQAAPVVRARAEEIPFRSRSFDAALAVLTVHHWSDHRAGLAELARLAPRQLVVTWDPAVTAEFWLIRDYLPEIIEHEANLPTLRAVTDMLAVERVVQLPVPADCTDGFLGSYWRRPAAYLSSDVRDATSGFARCEPATIARAMARLEHDLATSEWENRNSSLLELGELDIGYRLVVATGLAA